MSGSAVKNFTHFICELSVCLFQRKDLFEWLSGRPPSPPIRLSFATGVTLMKLSWTGVKIFVKNLIFFPQKRQILAVQPYKYSRDNFLGD